MKTFLDYANANEDVSEVYLTNERKDWKFWDDALYFEVEVPTNINVEYIERGYTWNPFVEEVNILKGNKFILEFYGTKTLPNGKEYDILCGEFNDWLNIYDINTWKTFIPSQILIESNNVKEIKKNFNIEVNHWNGWEKVKD